MSMKSNKSLKSTKSERNGSRKGSTKLKIEEPEQPEIKMKVYQQVMFERRVLLVCTFMIAVFIIVWAIAISTNYWVIIDCGDGIYIPEIGRYLLYSHSGIWSICRYTFSNGTSSSNTSHHIRIHNSTSNNTVTRVSHRRVGKITYIDRCWNQDMFSNMNLIDKAADATIIEYNRAEGVFSGITLLLMSIGLFFSCYCFKNPRYMFKRTAGGIHFLSTATCLVVLEVLINSVEYEKKNIPFIYPPGAKSSYGFSFVLAWLVFICNILCGFLFMLYSRKRKCKKAATMEMGLADEPTIIGR